MFKNLPKIENRKLKILLLPLSHIQRSSLFIVSLKHSLKIENWKLKIFRNFLVHAKYFYLIIAQLENSLKIKNWKLKIILLLFFLLSFSSADAATLIRPPNNLGLVGYWSFNEGVGTQAGDYSGNGNTGTLTNGPTWTDGRLGKALNFDGTNDYVNAGNNSSLNVTNNTLSISVWVKRGVTTSTGTMVQRGVGGENGYTFGVGVAPCTTNQIKVTKFAVADICIGSFPSDTSWHHITTVWSSTGVVAYIDGIASTPTSSDNSNFISSPYNLQIGAGTVEDASYFNGQIDEVRIYNRALSASEISTVYRTGSVRRSTPTNLGLIAHWSFNDGSGTQAGDFSGNGNHGTLQSFSNPATATSGWGAGRFGSGLNFDGTNDYISTTKQYTNPQTFTLSGWFKTTSANGKKIVGFENAQTGTGGASFDRHIYMGTDGKIYFGWYDNGAQYVVSTETLSEGKWHHFLATHNGSTGQLFIDGVSQGTNTGTPQSYSGYWRVGGYKLETWTNATDGYFDGAIDDIRIYDRVLSAEERNTLFLAGGETKFNTTPTNFLTSGLVGHWTFDGKDMNWTTGTLSDKSSQGNNGQVVSMSTTTTPTIGKIGQAFNFNGSNSIIRLSNISLTNSVTITAWAKTNLANSQARHVVSHHPGWFISGEPDLNTMRCDINTGTQTSVSFDSFTNIGQEWHFYACVYNGSNITTFLDGVQKNQTAKTGNIDLSGNTRIGGYWDETPGFAWNGSIDEVRIYNRALSASEVQQLYLMGK